MLCQLSRPFKFRQFKTLSHVQYGATYASQQAPAAATASPYRQQQQPQTQPQSQYGSYAPTAKQNQYKSNQSSGYGQPAAYTTGQGRGVPTRPAIGTQGSYGRPVVQAPVSLKPPSQQASRPVVQATPGRGIGAGTGAFINHPI